MKTIRKQSLHTTLALSAAISSAFGGSAKDAPFIETPPAAETSPWEFRVEPYGWLTGLEGTTALGPLVTDIDAPFFSDIADVLKMAAALQVEARYERWGIIADGFYADLGSKGSTPGPLYDQASLDLKQFIGELYLAYRIYETPSAFVDLYAGMRYNNLSMDLNATLNPAGILGASQNASQRILSGIDQRAQAIVQPRASAFKAGNAARRATIETQVTTAIEAEAERRVKRDLESQIRQIRRDGGPNARDIASDRIIRAAKAQRLELARSTAQLEVAKLRASVDATKQAEVTRAQARVNTAEQDLATAINTQLVSALPTSSSADKEWIDPIVGLRAQWNINNRWYLAGSSDIGGFSVGSDLAWTLQGTVGYQFTEKVSAELGYRYMNTDYEDGAFRYDVEQAGLYTGLNIRF